MKAVEAEPGGRKPPVMAGNCTNAPLRVSMRVVVARVADPKRSEVSPSHDVKCRLKDRSADVSPEVPLHLEGMGRPAGDLVFVHQGSRPTHGTNMPIMPAFCRGSVPSNDCSNLEELHTVGGL